MYSVSQPIVKLEKASHLLGLRFMQEKNHLNHLIYQELKNLHQKPKLRSAGEHRETPEVYLF